MKGFMKPVFSIRPGIISVLRDWHKADGLNNFLASRAQMERNEAIEVAAHLRIPVSEHV